jgi:hypothetical protein
MRVSLYSIAGELSIRGKLIETVKAVVKLANQ